MGCETGNCPECIIRVGATNVTPVNYHLFIWYTDGERDIVYRGGPKSGSTYQFSVDAGLAAEYIAPTNERFDIDWPWSNLVTHRQEGLTRNYDYEKWNEKGSDDLMVTVAEGSAYCGLDEVFSLQTQRIGELGRTYNAIDIDRADNSNATVYTILQEMELPLLKPDISAPGWGINLHQEETLPETIERSVNETMEGAKANVREVERQMNWFDSLSAVDQIHLLRRMFGGR